MQRTRNAGAKLLLFLETSKFLPLFFIFMENGHCLDGHCRTLLGRIIHQDWLCSYTLKRKP